MFWGFFWSHLHLTENMDHLPDNNSRYKDVDYWDERYKTEQSYDWLGSFSKFQHILENHVKKEDSILMLGKKCFVFLIAFPLWLEASSPCIQMPPVSPSGYILVN